MFFFFVFFSLGGGRCSVEFKKLFPQNHCRNNLKFIEKHSGILLLCVCCICIVSVFLFYI